MGTLQDFNSQYNDINTLINGYKEWVICYDTPIHYAQGVYYQYPGESQQFVAGGYYWSCPSNEHDIWKLCFQDQVICNLYEYIGGTYVYTPGVIKQLLPVCFNIPGNFQGVKPLYPEGVDVPLGSQIYEAYSAYGLIIYTDQGKFPKDWYGVGGFVTVDGTSADPDGSGAVPGYTGGSGGQISNFAKNSQLSLVSAEKQSFYNGQPLTTYTFTVYDESGNVLFTRTDNECPSAWLQKEDCRYTGNWTKIYIRLTLFTNGRFIKNYSTLVNSSNGSISSCVTVLGQMLPGLFNIPLIQLPENLDSLYIALPFWSHIFCSPPNCGLFPKIEIDCENRNNQPSNQQCPPGSCEVNCGGTTCCYDTHGNLVSSFTSAQDNNSSQYNSNISQSTIATNTTNYVNTNTNNPLSFGTSQVINSSFLEGTV